MEDTNHTLFTILLNITRFTTKFRFNFSQINNSLFQFKTLDELNEEFDLSKGKVLGKGAFGEVLKCQSSVDWQYYAIKMM